MSAEYNCPPVCPQCHRCHRGPCQPDSRAHCAVSPGSAPSSYFGGCDRHRDRIDFSCCKIRRADGSPLTTADAWEEIQRLREALKWAEAYVPKRADCETRRMIESLLPNAKDEPQARQNTL